MERSRDEDRPQDDGKAGGEPSRSAQALARARAALEARRERDAIRLRHPAFRNNDARTLMREASEIAVAAGLATDGVTRDPPPAALPPAALPRLAPPEPESRPLPPPAAAVLPAPRFEPPAAAILPSRWDERAPPGFHRQWAGRVRSGLGRVDVLRVGLATVLVLVAAGALYGVLQAVQRQDDSPPVAARPPPPALELRPIRVKTIRIPVPSQPEAASAASDLSLRGAIPGFAQVVPGAPAEACATLVAAGWSTDGWTDSPVAARGECLAERRYGGNGETNSFAVLRGGHTLSELRIKLNLGDAAWAAEAGRDAGRLVATLFGTWRWEGGAALENRIAALQPFETAEANGTTVRLTREHGDVERLNLLLRFPQPLRTPGMGAAEAQAAALATLSAIVAAHVGGAQAAAEPAAAEPPRP